MTTADARTLLTRSTTFSYRPIVISFNIACAGKLKHVEEASTQITVIAPAAVEATYTIFVEAHFLGFFYC